MALRFVTATRSSLAEFEAQSPLCRSLKRASECAAIELTVTPDNRSGLPQIYNKAIESAAPHDALVFIHDDVWVDDWLIGLRLTEALSAFDVIGIAGNTRRVPHQQSWILKGATDEKDDGFLSGAVAHGAVSESRSHRFGPAPAEVQLLDGVMLAARAASLQQKGVRFDAQFDFHFYDTDFCRSCTAAGLRLGTWPIAITHASAGRYKTPAWDQAYGQYLAKWGS